MSSSFISKNYITEWKGLQSSRGNERHFFSPDNHEIPPDIHLIPATGRQVIPLLRGERGWGEGYAREKGQGEGVLQLAEVRKEASSFQEKLKTVLTTANLSSK